MCHADAEKTVAPISAVSHASNIAGHGEHAADAMRDEAAKEAALNGIEHTMQTYLVARELVRKRELFSEKISRAITRAGMQLEDLDAIVKMSLRR